MKEYEVTSIKVGEKFTLFGGDRHLFREGAFFEALEDDDGYLFVIYLPRMTRQEKNILRLNKIQTRYIREGNKILFLLRFEHTPLIFEANFNPVLYKDNRAMQLTFRNHMMTFVGIDSSTNIVQTLRTANFPQRLKQVLVTVWSQAIEQGDSYSDEYDMWVKKLYRSSTIELWDKATESGYFGEEYN